MNDSKNESGTFLHLKTVAERKKTVHLILLYFGKL